jgi:hypothetical protein
MKNRSKREPLVRNESKTPHFQHITANISTKMVRNEMMEGRNYTVAPMVMIVEGVLPGTNGPLLYTENELSKTPQVWNYKPIVVYHPEINGEGISACDPTVITNQKIGVIMNTEWDSEGKRLKAEAWIEETRASTVDSRVETAIQNQNMMELSTGLFADYEETSGEFNGKTYDAIVRNIRPDHLAVLPDKSGACSIADGAGFIRNQLDQKSKIPENILNAAGVKVEQILAPYIENEMSFDNVRMLLWTALRKKFNIQNDIKGPNLWVEDVYENFVVYEYNNTLWKLNYTLTDNEVSLEGNPVEVKRVTQYQTTDGVFVGNEKMMKTEGGEKYPAEAYAYVPDSQKPSTWKLRLWETPTKKETAAQVGRAIAAIGKGYRGNKVQLPTEAVKGVKAKIRAAWKRTNPNKEGDEMPAIIKNERKTKMNKTEFIDALIANENTEWNEDDREVLDGMSEETLEKIAPKETPEEQVPEKQSTEPDKGEEAGSPVENECSIEDYIAKAPKGIQEVLSDGLATHNTERQKMIGKIVANKRNQFTKPQLEGMTSNQLRAIAAIAEPEKQTTPTNNYIGAAGHGTSPVDNANCGEPLTMPTIDWTNK